jgi:hypothetical protein
MQIQCVGCRTVVPTGATHCPVCGRPVDADGNGLPDAIDQLVQNAAKQAVAAERAQYHAAEVSQQDAKKRRMTEALLRRNLEAPRTWSGLALHRLRVSFVVLFFFAGTVGTLPLALLSSAGLSLAGPALCAVQCPDCHPPGRGFSWNYRGNCQSLKGRMGSAYVCHNPHVDVDRLRRTEVSSDPLNTALQPYILSAVLLHFADAFAWSLLLASLRAIFGTSRALRDLETQRIALERTLGRR